jgi:hypothetical protein
MALRDIKKRKMRTWSTARLRRQLKDRRVHRDVRCYAYAILLKRRMARHRDTGLVTVPGAAAHTPTAHNRPHSP